jgi:CDP-diglyceride synthetase
MQIARESFISHKWTIITIAIAASLFFNYLITGKSDNLWKMNAQLLQKPGAMFFTIIAISYYNGLFANVALMFGVITENKGNYHPH